MAFAKIVQDGTTLIDLTQDTVTAASMLSGVTAHKNDGTSVTGTIATKTSSNMTVSGATVTAPAGYYASDASKSVASGSATTPATTITTNPSITVSSSGLITATNSKTQNVTPTVSAGYVSSGTAGTITVSGSNTSQLTTQAAQTITPTTTDQTIASGKYLTGAQTIKGDANLIAGNIKQGVTIFGVQGTHSGGITPSGTISIAQNGTYDVTNYASANVNVSGGGGITLKRIAGTGRNNVNVSGWGGNDFITASSLNENPTKVVFANITYLGRIYTCSPTPMFSPSTQYFHFGGTNTGGTKVYVTFDITGSALNYKTVRMYKCYYGSTDITGDITGWEIYSNIPSVPQFSFDMEFDGALIDTYTADEGGTWNEWVNSGYNPDQLYQIDGENIIYDNGGIQLYVCDSNLDPVTIDMEIIEGETYQLVMM